MPVPAGRRTKWVTLWALGAAVPDGDGGFTQARTALSPAAVWAEIRPASARDLERTVAGTVQSTATHLVAMPYHAGVTTNTVIVYDDRTFAVTGVVNLDERNRETICAVTEVVA